MKSYKFGIIISLILLIYLSLNYYLFIRLINYFHLSPRGIIIVEIIIITAVLLYFVGSLLEKKFTNRLSAALIIAGSLWMAISVYLALLLGLTDFLNFIFNLAGFGVNIFAPSPTMGSLVLLVTAIILIVGYLNIKNPSIKRIKLKINKNGGKLKRLNMVVVSDLHIGTFMNKKMVGKIVKMINELKPDIVVFPGDIVDEDLPRIIKFDEGEPLKNIKSEYGQFAVTGNHEYIGGVEKAKDYLMEKGINLLEDTLFFINDSFFLIGREDIAINHFEGKERLPLKEIMNFADPKMPLILLDHQPFNLSEAADNNIDLQLSGHTHNGQLWPFNFITELVYEKSYGYLKKGNTQYYISSGTGVWGPPIKTTGRAEIVLLEIEFADS